MKCETCYTLTEVIFKRINCKTKGQIVISRKCRKCGYLIARVGKK